MSGASICILQFQVRHLLQFRDHNSLNMEMGGEKLYMLYLVESIVK